MLWYHYNTTILNRKELDMTRREKFTNLLIEHGYTSINNFCIQNKLIQSNVNNRAKDESIKVELPVLFLWAKILHEPIDVLIEIFYPEEYEENQTIAKGKKK